MGHNDHCLYENTSIKVTFELCDRCQQKEGCPFIITDTGVVEPIPDMPDGTYCPLRIGSMLCMRRLCGWWAKDYEQCAVLRFIINLERISNSIDSK